MSRTLGESRYNIRKLLGDLSPGKYAVAGTRLDLLINYGLATFGEMVGLSELTELTETSLSAGSHDYEMYLATTAEYERVIEVAYLDGGGVRREVSRRGTVDEINALRDGVSSTQTGNIELWATQLRRTGSAGDAERTYIWTWPAMSNNPSVSGWRIRVANWPASVADDADVIPLRASLAAAFEQHVALQAVNLIEDSERKRILMQSGVVGLWNENVKTAIANQRAQQSRPQRQSGLVRVEA